ncbi:MAG: hypothetical protein AB1551_04715, partial [Actinomycetota bacterium]
MHARIRPGGTVRGEFQVPGDKSIAHRWLILAATGRGRSQLALLPGALDVRSSASCLAQVSPSARPSLKGWVSGVAEGGESQGFAWGGSFEEGAGSNLVVEGKGRTGLSRADGALDCGN